MEIFYVHDCIQILYNKYMFMKFGMAIGLVAFIYRQNSYSVERPCSESVCGTRCHVQFFVVHLAECSRFGGSCTKDLGSHLDVFCSRDDCSFTLFRVYWEHLRRRRSFWINAGVIFCTTPNTSHAISFLVDVFSVNGLLKVIMRG